MTPLILSSPQSLLPPISCPSEKILSSHWSSSFYPKAAVAEIRDVTSLCFFSLTLQSQEDSNFNWLNYLSSGDKSNKSSTLLAR